MYWDENGIGYFFPPPEEGSDKETKAWKEFRQYDRAHPAIWEEFEKKALEAYEKGFRKIGAHFIIQGMRWEGAVKVNVEIFKVDNSWFPYYARKFMQHHPKCVGLFELRRLRRD